MISRKYNLVLVNVGLASLNLYLGFVYASPQYAWVSFVAGGFCLGIALSIAILGN